MDLNLVDSILITFKNGEEFRYRGRGLAKLRREIINGPPLRKKGVERTPVVIIDSDEEEPEVEIATPIPPEKPKSHLTTARGNPYQTTSLDYSDISSGNVYEKAKKMSAGSGLDFS